MITIKYERKCDGGWMECEELYINTQPGMRSVIKIPRGEVGGAN